MVLINAATKLSRTGLLQILDIHLVYNNMKNYLSLETIKKNTYLIYFLRSYKNIFFSLFKKTCAVYNAFSRELLKWELGGKIEHLGGGDLI